MSENYPTIKEGPDPGLYELQSPTGRYIATLQTLPDGGLIVRGLMRTLLIKPEAANSIIVTFES
jgi:hypothetical protein